MKEKYWLFAGDVYYPQRGINDYKGAFDELVLAQLRFKNMVELEDRMVTRWWAQIVNKEEGEMTCMYDQNIGFWFYPNEGWYDESEIERFPEDMNIIHEPIK